MNNDIPRHAAAKVKRALDDAHQIASDPGEMFRIALMGAGICIGQAVGISHGMMQLEGATVTEREVKEHVMELLRIMTLEGADAVWQKLQQR